MKVLLVYYLSYESYAQTLLVQDWQGLDFVCSYKIKSENSHYFESRC